jgi:hypothetical protein
MTPAGTYRGRLNAARERKRSAIDRRNDAVKMRDLARAANDAQALSVAETRLGDADMGLHMAQELENAILGQMTGVGSGLVESALEDPGTIRLLEQLANNVATPVGSVMLGQVMSREDLVAQFEQSRTMAAGTGFNYNAPTAPLDDGFGRLAPFGGVIQQLRRRLRLLDLMPSMTMENKVLPYVQESGSLDTAAETAEAATSPEAEQILTDAEARAASIPHWLKIPREVLADVPGLATAINSRLLYGVQRRFEAQILGGDGTGDNILGILNTTGIGDVAYSATELEADQALEGIVTVLLSNAEPNGVLLHPTDWKAILTKKSAGSGEYLSMGPFVQTAEALWGTVAIPSAAIAPGTALVGDFGVGATALIREGVNVRVSDSDQDDFLKRRVTVLAEMRGGVAIWQPSAFCVVHFAA